jgi:hypothetical protein
VGECTTRESDKECIQNFGGENLKVRDHSEDLDVDVKIILEWILRKCGEKYWIRFIRLRVILLADFCEYGNDILGSIKRGEFLD